MKRIVLFFLIGLNIVAQSTFSQENNSVVGSSKIKGILFEGVEELPVGFANVVLYNEKDSTIVTWSISSEKGSFELNKIAQGKYKLVTNFIGYETLSLNNISVTQANK